MPNWCSNTLTLRHTDPAMIRRAVEAFHRGAFFHEFVPVPQDLLDTVSGWSNVAEEQAAREAQEVANVEKHGFKNWYDHNVARWGVKWDVGSEDDIEEFDGGKEISVTFDTAWAPPIEFYQALGELGFFVDAYYYEPGMSFCGHYTTDGGDEYYEITGDSDWVEENIPSDINEVFSISESMAQWEDEHEEDEGDEDEEYAKAEEDDDESKDGE